MTDTTRDAFEAYAKTKHLDLTRGLNAWDCDIYKHSHIDAMWFGWQAALAEREKRQPLTANELFANDYLMALNAMHGMQMSDIVNLVRVIEAAHGIKA